MSGITGTTIKEQIRRLETPLEEALRVEYEKHLEEQAEYELNRRERYMEEAGEAFRRWFGDYRYHFEQGEMVQGAGIGAPLKILVLRSGEIRLYYQMAIGYHRFNLVRICDNCGNTFLDLETWVNNLRQLAIEVKREGKWYCPRCDV